MKKISLIFTLALITQLLSAQMKLSPLFSNNMVLQQQTSDPIWGKASANEKITIHTSWNKMKYETIADKTGDWKLNISTPSAGGPYEITISGKKTIKLKNVMIGEVWLCFGQSNMEMPLAGWGKVENYEQEISNANYPNIRLMQVEKNVSPSPISDFNAVGNGWQICSPQTIAEFSATAYFFGRHLNKTLDVPIGLIHTSWGGTLVEAWTSSESLKMVPYFNDALETMKQIPADIGERNKLFTQIRNDWNMAVENKDFGYKNGKIAASAVDFDDASWKTMQLPRFWEDDIPDFDGFVWFRKTIDIPADWAGKELIFHAGGIDDNDVTFFNNVKIGSKEGWDQKREYHISPKLVKQGKAVIAIRVMDSGGGGGIHGNAENLFISLKNNANEKISLASVWKYKVAVDMKDIPMPQILSNNSNNPTVLYNAMIEPLVPYSIKGAIWYQGEANVDRAYQYRDLLPLMINDWRSKWNYSFPFYFVQLANYLPQKSEPTESIWAELREAQMNTLHLENTGMAVITDIGEALDIHPKNKQDVGKRLALIAENQTYGHNQPYSGPLFSTYKIEGNKIRISFNHFDGLKISDGKKLSGFSIAGTDHKFHWADAEIIGNNIIVSSPNVPFPVAVRYAWADNPNSNLTNNSGLPASPFRTDNWTEITRK